MKTTHTRGFTLIELLVVIAIIGILASVVLASLNSARDKGADAAIKSNLNNARAQAELFYDDNGRSYDHVCESAYTGSVFSLLSGAASAGGWTVVVTDGTAGTNNTVICHGTATGWAAAAPLKTGQYYCVDSTGKALTSSSTLAAASDVSC